MNKKITVGLFCLMMSSLYCKINAQNYQTLNVTSGYNADLIANGQGTAFSSTTESVDDPANGFVFMSTDFVNGQGVAPASGLPSAGLINSATTTGLPFQLAPYTANNALKLSDINDSGILNFSSNPKASKLFMLATTGSGSAVAEITVTFTDNTTQVFTSQSVSDWYGGSYFAIKGIGRTSRVTDDIENNINDPRLYEIALSISSANQVKNISNVSVKKTSADTGYLCVFGFSYQVAGNCITPDSLTTTNLTSNSATVSWSSIAGASSYEIYRSVSNTVPTAATTPTYTGITAPTKNLTGLSAATPYSVWVRSNCGGGSVSDWSFVLNFTTQCEPINAPYSENFDSATTIPLCTSVQTINTTGGNWDVSDATGVSDFSSNALYSITQTNPTNTWFYTPGINLQAGTTYTLSFDYSNYYQPGKFKVAYGTGASSALMTNIIQDYPNVNVGTITPASFTITPAATGVYYFGFNDYTPAVPLGIMLIDNIVLTVSNLSTSENQLSKNTVAVYPNPTSDYLNVRSKQKNAGIKIYDVSGKMVLSLDKAEQKIDVSQLMKGTYFLTLKNADGTSSTNKFIKK